MAKSNDVRDAFARLAAAEEQFLNREFLAPVRRAQPVHVRIAGVVCSLTITPTDFEGWGVFRPRSHKDAAFMRPAKLAERQRYLELFPLVRLILLDCIGDRWQAVPAHKTDARFSIEGRVPVRLVEDAQPFEVIETRFDGSQFWYAAVDDRREPGTAKFLREHLQKLTPPEQVQRSGLTAEERLAYEMAYRPRYEATEEAKLSRDERRLRNALAHAGAELKEYVERHDVYTVTYEVDGERHVSAIAKGDLTVQAAGICLSGEDANFDLQSLVGVIREGRRGGLVRMGDWD